nr:MAG TPA: hypothetical protein [Caudoviricetes sp.]
MGEYPPSAYRRDRRRNRQFTHKEIFKPFQREK